MPDPLLLPSIAMLTGGGIVAAQDYLKRRLSSPEDRYMSLYGRSQWEASNMDLALHTAPELDGAFKSAFLARLEHRLRAAPPEATQLLREEAVDDGRRLTFVPKEQVDVDDLVRPRRGVYLDLSASARVRVVWNHMQTDGVGMWNALRELFDPNPPLVPYKDVPAPPAVLPELIALPSVARRLVWRGRLRKENGSSASLQRGLALWSSHTLRQAKKGIPGSFNLFTTALVVDRVFARHPERNRLNVGVTAYFPFLEGRNRYGVFLCKVTRGSVADIQAQLVRQTRNPVKTWGMSAAQSYALGRLPNPAFQKVVTHFRRQVDVLVSSLPVGRQPITLERIPVVVSCHPWELTLPYYFLLVGTRTELHVSFTSRFPQDESFLALPADPAAPPLSLPVTPSV